MMSKYETKALHFKGGPKDKTYDGLDHVAKQPVSVKAGDHFEVSEEKADQLMADFPHLFEASTKAKAKADEKADEKAETKKK